MAKKKKGIQSSLVLCPFRLKLLTRRAIACLVKRKCNIPVLNVFTVILYSLLHRIFMQIYIRVFHLDTCGVSTLRE